MRKDVAIAKGITKISDLRAHPELRFGFIHEFLDRPDGWPGVKQRYELPQTSVQGMNHSLAYRALVERAIDVTEMYTTDGEIAQYDLLALKDDRDFFPAYEAVWLYRADLAEGHPAVAEQLRRLESHISEAQMQRMNGAVQEGKRGLTGIPASLRESAEALGLPPLAILWRIELPLAMPTILADVQTAAVINVGTATLGGFNGAGGYGGPILRGIDKFDVPLMLDGAVPAAQLALVIEG